MAEEVIELKTFNRGLISPLALARTDLERVGLSAETMSNWMPRNLGSMMLRPGKSFIGNTRSDLVAKFIPFIFSATDTALLELTATTLRVWVNDVLVTRVSVSSSVTNGNFTSNLTSWTDNDDTGATSLFVTGGFMGLQGSGTLPAKREQSITVSGADQNKEHALDIVIERGPVTLRVGSTGGSSSTHADDDYISETTLDTGSHSLTLTPTGNFFIEFSSDFKREVLVDSCNVASSGTMTVTAPWAAVDLGILRYDLSADIIFFASGKTTDNIGYRQYKIERRSNNSWSVVKYEPVDGPFRTINITPITLTPSALSGPNVTLTASSDYFTSANVGSLFRVSSVGQTVTASLTAQNTFTNTIRVTGVTSARIFTITISGRADSTITLQRSLETDTGPFESLTPTYTADNTFTFDDTLDNQIAFYRIGIVTGDYGTDTVVLTLDYPIGSIDGIALVTDFTSSLIVNTEVIVDFGRTTASDDWYEGEWSDRRGFPTAVAFVEGRLGWGGRARTWLSVSDAFTSFDDSVIGDSGTIRRSIASGPIDNVNWMVALRRLIFSTDSAEFSLRASSDDEPLTPTNASIKSFTTQGSAKNIAVKLDNSAIFTQKGGTRIYEAAFGANYNYDSFDLTTFYPEAGGDSPITHIAVQRQPDTRIHCVRADGSVAILLHDKAENVSCWILHTGGVVEDIVILPGASGDGEDAVYYVIKRTINSSTVRFLEKWVLESQCQGGTTSRQSDAHVIGTISGGIMTGLTHLEGETVVIWVNGKDIGTATVSGGQITGLSEDGANACAGLAYTAQFKSTKLGNLTEKKNITRLGVILHNTHFQGLTYGADFSNLDPMPLMKDEVQITSDTVHSQFDEESFSFDGIWDSDSRLHLQAASPRPCTILAAILGVE